LAIKACKEKGYHITVDTAGACRKSDFEQILGDTDLFLYDLKFMDNKLHKKYVGASNKNILSNLEFLLKEGKEVIIRIPVIPCYTGQDENIKLIKGYLIDKKDKIKEIHLLPFHNTGESKYKRFDFLYNMKGLKSQSPQDLIYLKEEFDQSGFQVKIGGL
jgi:pyruvate formate lyase activating enzyme